MSNLIINAKAWRFAILWFVLFSLNALGTSIIASLTGAQWDELKGQQKFLICTAIFVNWTGTIMAYMSRAAKKIESGQLPFDDTSFQTKTPTDPKP